MMTNHKSTEGLYIASTDTTIKKEEQVTGREIIQDYLELKPASLAKYQELLKVLNFFDSWSDFSRSDFIEQFLDLYGILDAKFQEIVQHFCKLQWQKVPALIRPQFVNFLTSLAIHHVCHISAVFNSFVNHFIPYSSQNMSTDLISDTYTVTKGQDNVQIYEKNQEEIYEMAHKSIRMVIDCNQLSSRILIKCCVKQFPHVRQSTSKLLDYIQNLIHITEYTEDEELIIELWSLIIDRLLQLDASIITFHDEESRLSICNSENPKNFNSELEDGSSTNITEKENLIEIKLDHLIAFILMYIGKKYAKQFAVQSIDPYADSNFNTKLDRLQIKVKAEYDYSFFNFLLEAFDEHVLSTIGVHCTPFIWFYICSLSKENCTRMLEFLWGVLQSPIESPNELKKTHNAAAFLCGFLARANYVDFELSYTWLKRISIWCQQYIDKYTLLSNEGLNVQAGGFQHGTFYATVQALLFIFCYRYGEISRIVAEIYALNLEKIIYNCLEPLFYISQGVALCFLNLSRRFQLFNCNNNLISDLTFETRKIFKSKRRRGSVELFFPFSFCSLRICSPFILPLMRRFSLSSTKLELNGINQQTDGIIDELPNSNNFLHDGADEMPVDEGYEEELMCVQSVSSFSRYLMMESDEKREREDMEC